MSVQIHFLCQVLQNGRGLHLGKRVNLFLHTIFLPSPQFVLTQQVSSLGEKTCEHIDVSIGHFTTWSVKEEKRIGWSEISVFYVILKTLLGHFGFPVSCSISMNITHPSPFWETYYYTVLQISFWYILKSMLERLILKKSTFIIFVLILMEQIFYWKLNKWKILIIRKFPYKFYANVYPWGFYLEFYWHPCEFLLALPVRLIYREYIVYPPK